MTDIFPPANLSDLSTPWARAHDTRLIAAEEKLDILGQDISGQNRNTASSLASLGNTVNELSQWTTYSAEEPYDASVDLADSPTFPWEGPLGSEVRFTVREPRMAKVEFSVYVLFSAFHNGTGALNSPYVNARLHFGWGGATSHLYSPLYQLSSASSGVNTGFYRGERISYWDIVNLSTAGTYRVGFIPEVVGISGTTGSARFQNPRVTVQILGPVD